MEKHIQMLAFWESLSANHKEKSNKSHKDHAEVRIVQEWYSKIGIIIVVFLRKNAISISLIFSNAYPNNFLISEKLF